VFYQEFCNDHGSNYEVPKENKKKSMEKGMLESLGAYKAKIYLSVNFNTTEVGRGVSIFT
jgi:hypothetical protein